MSEGPREGTHWVEGSAHSGLRGELETPVYAMADVGMWVKAKDLDGAIGS